jgi:hypothetical protein
MTPLPSLSRIAALALALLGAAAPLHAETSNGNDFALYFYEAKDDNERNLLFEDAKDRPHFFRYLQIMEINPVEENGLSGMRIITFEPASWMDVAFTVVKPVSLSILNDDPVSKIGDAIAVTGKLTDVSHEQNVILLEGTIVRHKDRLSPKIGKELLCEVVPGAVFYNYTAGSRPVTLTYQDRDLLKHKDKIIAESGPEGWVEFLEREVAKRKQEAKARKSEEK